MTLRRPLRFALALGSGLAWALAFPDYNFPLVAWFAIALLLLASFGAHPWEGALYGFLHGALFFWLTIPWIGTVMRVYGNVPPTAASGILGLVIFAASLFPAAFGFCVARWSRTGVVWACLFAPFLWVLLEFGRTNLPIVGFPWNLAGYSISGHLALVQLTAWTGIYGLSFLVVAFNALLAWTAMSQTRYARWIASAVAVILILAIAVGGYFVPKAPAQHVAHLVHTQFPQYMSFPPDWMHIHAGDMKELEERSIAAGRAAPGLIVWPEVPAPFSLEDPEFAALAERIAQNSGSDFLVGVDDWKLGPKGRWSVSNSAVLLEPSGRHIFVYDKIHLVPFGEYVPLRRWLFFAKKLTAEIGDFQPGSTYNVGKLPGGRFGVFICYEAVFGAEVRRFAANGAELFINMSNDGWFGHSGAPAQHFMMARVRAVEDRRWLLRATNTGYTAAVDPYGRVVAEFSSDTLGVLDVPYDFRSNRTFYTRYGDWLGWVSLIVVAAGLVLAKIISREEKEEEKEEERGKGRE